MSLNILIAYKIVHSYVKMDPIIVKLEIHIVSKCM